MSFAPLCRKPPAPRHLNKAHYHLKRFQTRSRSVFCRNDCHAAAALRCGPIFWYISCRAEGPVPATDFSGQRQCRAACCHHAVMLRVKLDSAVLWERLQRRADGRFICPGALQEPRPLLCLPGRLSDARLDVDPLHHRRSDVNS